MISKRARYALHGVGFLAWFHGGGLTPFADILKYLKEYSGELSLSQGYIAKIFQDLARGGIVRSTPGRRGGYGLARAPEDVRVVDIVSAVDGPPLEDCCLLSIGGCDNQSRCGVNQIIRQAQASFHAFLAGEDAASLAEKMFGTRGPPGFGPVRPAKTSAGPARGA